MPVAMFPTAVATLMVTVSAQASIYDTAVAANCKCADGFLFNWLEVECCYTRS